MFDRVRQLRAAGKTMRAIAAETGVGWRTVTKWVRSGCLPDRTSMTPRPSSPGYFKDYLSQRWAAVSTHGRHLFWDIRNQGYTGQLLPPAKIPGHVAPHQQRNAGSLAAVRAGKPGARSDNRLADFANRRRVVVTKTAGAAHTFAGGQDRCLETGVAELRYHAATGDVVSWYPAQP
jgi:hypothetical protein